MILFLRGLFLAGSLLYFSSLLFVHVSVCSESNHTLSEDEKGIEKYQNDFDLCFQPGLIERVLIQSEIQKEISEPILKAELQPQELFKSLNRSLLIDILLLSLLLLCCFLLGLVLFGITLPYRFISSLFQILAIFVSLYFALSLALYWWSFNLVFGENSIPMFFDSKPILFVFIEAILLLSGMISLLLGIITKRSVSFPLTQESDPFLRFYATKQLSFKKLFFQKNSNATGVFLFHFILITLLSLFFANLILIPILRVQLVFPKIFGWCLVLVLMMLGAYYIRAYYQIVAKELQKKGLLSVTLFLSYRIIQNMFQGIFLVSVLVIVFGSIFILALENIKFLQSFHILLKSTSL